MKFLVFSRAGRRNTIHCGFHGIGCRRKRLWLRKAPFSVTIVLKVHYKNYKNLVKKPKGWRWMEPIMFHVVYPHPSCLLSIFLLEMNTFCAICIYILTLPGLPPKSPHFYYIPALGCLSGFTHTSAPFFLSHPPPFSHFPHPNPQIILLVSTTQFSNGLSWL